jgi:large subunit ribosomal protein L32
MHLVRCSHCGSMRLPHHACPDCGTYKGKEVLDIEVEKKK